MGNPNQHNLRTVTALTLHVIILAGCSLINPLTPTPAPPATTTLTPVPSVTTVPTPTVVPTATEVPATPTATAVPTLSAEQQQHVLVLINRDSLLPKGWQVNAVSADGNAVVDQIIAPDLEAMLADMRSIGLDPVITSSYRSSQEQQNLFDYTANYYYQQGSTWDDAVEQTLGLVAKPGTSEHESGLAVDIYDRASQTAGVYNPANAVNTWLRDNSWKYGFILRYTLENHEKTGYAPEPWHFRYVGRDPAKSIYEQGLTLEEYLKQR